MYSGDAGVDCPACKKLLIVAERQGIELDCCPACRGLWFDAGELDLLAEKLGLPQGEHDPARFALADVKEKTRRCPRCDSGMEKVFFDPGKTIVLDRCERGHGLWFDQGELAKVLGQLAQLSAGAHETLVSFLGESFRA
jgi:Zn-finger nucleic acid-binding protein